MTLTAMPTFQTGNKLRNIYSHDQVLIMQFNNHTCHVAVKWFSGESKGMNSNVACV